MDLHLHQSLFSKLPQDIGRVAFEDAAEDCNTAALSCALVSKKVNSWVEPIIYRHVSLDARPKAELFYRTIAAPTSSKPVDFFAMNVKSLLITYNSRVDEIISILTTCHSVQTLVLWILVETQGTFKDAYAITTSSILAPKRISIPASALPPGQAHFHYPLFRHVTHLEVLCNSEGQWTWNGLSELQHLTHLCIDLQYPSRKPAKVVRETISECPASLRVFVVFVMEEVCFGYMDDDGEESVNATDGIGEVSSGKVDIRAVVALMDGDPIDGINRDFEDIQKDWCYARTEGGDFWSQAEQIIEDRRRAASQKT